MALKVKQVYRIIHLIVLSGWITSCQSNTDNANIISKDTISNTSVDNIEEHQKKVTETKITDNSVNKTENDDMSGYFLCTEEIPLEDKSFKGMYIDFNKLDEAYFYLWDNSIQKRLEIKNNKISLNSNLITMTGSTSDLKLEFEGEILFDADEWPNDIDTVVLKGTLTSNGILMKNIEFVSTVGE